MQHKLRNYLYGIIISLLFLCQVTLSQAEGSTTAINSGATDKGKVASVNGSIISQAQFDNALGYQKEIAALRGVTITEEQMSELKYEVLENLISTELLYQESQKSGIKIEETEINEAYESQKQKGQFNTDAEFEEALKQSNKSIAAYRAEIKQGLAIDRFVQNKFTDKTVVSDAEAKEYYNDYPSYFQQPAQARISHIMITIPSNADQSQKDAARAKIEEAMRRLKTGDNFETLAREISEDTTSKDNGGDIGYFYKGQAPQSFEDAAFALDKDEISDIVETGSGYHIIKLTDKTDARTVSYEEAKGEIIENLKSGKVSSAINKYIIALRNRSTIETYPIDK
ncbi:MAG: peptidylprolyl isomerase [Deltaproteobacteria bacterium]|nr:peptidylprolyl isomerase [Deltaproteobacteria bacterium]